MAIFIFFLIVLIIIVLMKFINNDDNSLNKHARELTRTRNKNWVANKEKYYKRFDFETYSEKLEENHIELTGVNIDSRIEPIIMCKDKEELMLIREHENEYDKNAVMVYRFTGELIGYLPRDEAARYSPLIDNGVPVRAYFGFHLYDEDSDYWLVIIYLVEYKKPGC